MTTETHRDARRYERISLPKGMSVAWYGGGQQQVSRVKSLSMGGVFLCGSNTLRLGTDLMLVFEVPGGMVLAEAIVRNVVPGEGIGVEFVNMNPQKPISARRTAKAVVELTILDEMRSRQQGRHKFISMTLP